MWKSHHREREKSEWERKTTPTTEIWLESRDLTFFLLSHLIARGERWKMLWSSERWRISYKSRRLQQQIQLEHDNVRGIHDATRLCALVQVEGDLRAYYNEEEEWICCWKILNSCRVLQIQIESKQIESWEEEKRKVSPKLNLLSCSFSQLLCMLEHHLAEIKQGKNYVCIFSQKVSHVVM